MKRNKVTAAEMEAAGVWVNPKKVTNRMMRAIPGYADGRLGKKAQSPPGKAKGVYMRAYNDGKEQRNDQQSK